MAGRRGKLGPAPKGDLGPAGSQIGTVTPTKVSAEGRNLENPIAAPNVLAIEEAVHTEHDRPRPHDAELLETVSPAAIQMHPPAATHPASHTATDDLAQAAQSPIDDEAGQSQAATPKLDRPSHESLAPLSPFWLPRAAARVNLTLWSHLQTETLSAVAHLGALSTATTPADIIGLQTREMERALHSTLDLGRDLAGAASNATSP